MTFSKSLNELLAIEKLDSVALEKLIRIAIAEDLAGATDVTSVATIPENQSAVAEFRSRKS
jgi:nicotinate-nucleotide pyrophosphorylase